MQQKILVTGGLGYIGSHACVELQDAGYDIVILDNLSNSDQSVLGRLEQITGKKAAFYEGDIRDLDLLNHIFETEKPTAVMHFAGLKSVGESIAKPLAYYQNNITGTLTILEAMTHHGIKNMIFSSSANVYGNDHKPPMTEDMATGTVTNPYGRTKYMIEEILKDMAKAHPDWSLTLLRYFNPVGNHETALIGEDPRGIPTNLIPYIAKVAKGELPHVNVWGDDYPTADGTGIRDYIHVIDLAKGHVAALQKLSDQAGVHIYNLGTGQGTSVMEAITYYEEACGHKIDYQIAPRRDGDIAVSYANADKALKDLGWKAEKTVAQAMVDSWNWINSKP